MQTSYYGESFELIFDCYDTRNEETEVDSAEYELYVDGAVVETGPCNVDGNEVKFRFVASHLGMNTIVIKWRMGQDAWISKFKLNVEDVS